MTAPDGEGLLGRCERIVALALARKADEAECYWEWEADVGVEVENNKVASTSGGRSQGGSVRVLANGRPGFAYLTRDEDAAQAVEQALRNARAMPAKGYHLPEARRVNAGRGAWDDEVAQLELAHTTAYAAELLAGAAEACPTGTVTGGGASLSAAVWALASSRGAAVHERATLASVSAAVVLEDAGGRSVSASESADSVTRRLDARGVGHKAGETTQSLRGPRPAKAGRTSLVLEPEVVAELMAGPAVSAATGDDAMRGQTFWSGRLAQAVAAASLSLADEPGNPIGIPGPAADGEGLAARRVPIVQDGVLAAYLFDSWDGHRHGRPSTHSAVRGGFKSRPGPGTHKLVLSGAQPRPPSALVADVDDGYLVDSVLGAHTANATTGEFSVTAPNVWRIRKGELDGPASELAIAGSLDSLLRSVRSVSAPAKWGDGWVMPRVVVDDVAVSV